MKYEFTGKTMEHEGHTLLQICAVEDRDGMEKGFVGGWIESGDNLSQKGSCFVYDDAKVYGNAVVEGDAMIRDDAIVCDNARVSEGADISGDAVVCKEAQVYGWARITDSAHISGSAHVYDSAAVRECAVVTDKAKVYGHARIAGHAEVFDGAEVYDNALVCEQAIAGYESVICGDAELKGSAYLGKGAYLNTSDACACRNAGNTELTAYRTKDNQVRFHVKDSRCVMEGTKDEIYGSLSTSMGRELADEMEESLGTNFTPLTNEDLAMIMATGFGVGPQR